MARPVGEADRGASSGGGRDVVLSGPNRAYGVLGWVGALAATPGVSPTPSAGPAAGRPVGLTLLIGVAIVGGLVYLMRRRLERADEVFDPRPRPRSDPKDEDDGAGPPGRGGGT